MIGQIYVPQGQPETNNLAIQSTNKLQLVNAGGTNTFYSVKAIDTNPANLNWRGNVF